MTLDPTILLLGLATTFVIAVRKRALGGGLAMLGIPVRSLAIDPIDAAIIAVGKGAFGGGLAMLGIPLRSLAIDPAPSLVA